MNLLPVSNTPSTHCEYAPRARTLNALQLRAPSTHVEYALWVRTASTNPKFAFWVRNVQHVKYCTMLASMCSIAQYGRYAHYSIAVPWSSNQWVTSCIRWMLNWIIKSLLGEHAWHDIVASWTSVAFVWFISGAWFSATRQCSIVLLLFLKLIF